MSNLEQLKKLNLTVTSMIHKLQHGKPLAETEKTIFQKIKDTFFMKEEKKKVKEKVVEKPIDNETARKKQVREMTRSGIVLYETIRQSHMLVTYSESENSDVADEYDSDDSSYLTDSEGTSEIEYVDSDSEDRRWAGID